MIEAKVEMRRSTPMSAKEYHTKYKDKIMAYLEAHKERRFNVNDVYEALKKEGSRVNLTTVYRNLDKLTESGTLIRYKTSDDESASFQYIGDDPECEEHLHLQCRACGRIYHLDCHFMNVIKDHILQEHDFVLECKGSVLVGLCPHCRIKAKSKT